MNAKEKLQKMDAEREALMIEIRAEETRDNLASQVQLVDRLLLDMKHQVAPCHVPLSSSKHVKLTFRSELCTSDFVVPCRFRDKCSLILSLTDKGRVRKGGGIRRITGNGEIPSYSKNKSTVSEKHVSKGRFVIRVDSGVYEFKGTDYAETVSRIAKELTGKASLTQIGGYRHKGDHRKNYPYLRAFNGTGPIMGKSSIG